MKLNKMLQSARENAGLSQQDLADLAEVSRITISRHENDDDLKKSKYSMYINLIRSIANKLNQNDTKEDIKFDSIMTYQNNDDDDNIVAEPFTSYEIPEKFTNSNGNEFIELPNGKYKVKVPRVPYKAYASFIECFDDIYKTNESFDTTYFTVDHIGKGNYISFVTGNDSMNNGGIYDTPGGADVLGRQIKKDLWQYGFRESIYGFIIVADKGIFHKDIRKHEQFGMITCVSRNQSPEFGNFDLCLDNIHSIWNVVKRTF